MGTLNLSKGQATAVFELWRSGGEMRDAITFGPRCSVVRYDFNGGYGVSVDGRCLEEYPDRDCFRSAYGQTSRNTQKET